MDTSEGRLAVWARRSAACAHSGPGGQSNGVPLPDFTNLSGVRRLSFNRLRNTGSIADSSRRIDATSFRTMIPRTRRKNDKGTIQIKICIFALQFGCIMMPKCAQSTKVPSNVAAVLTILFIGTRPIPWHFRRCHPEYIELSPAQPAGGHSMR